MHSPVKLPVGPRLLQLLITAIMLSLTLSGCAGGSAATKNPTSPTAPTAPVAAALVSVSVVATSPSLNVGQGEQFTATATYSDGSTAAITPQSWSSSSVGSLSVSPAGLGTSLAYGQVIVSATFQGVTGSTTVIVHGGVLAVTITGSTTGMVTVSSGAGTSTSLSQSANLQLPPGAVKVFGNAAVSGGSRYLPNAQSQTVSIPDGGNASVTIDYSTIIPTYTKVLDSEGLSSLVVAADLSSITLSSTSSVASSLSPQDVLAIGICGAAPSGFLLRIISVTLGTNIITAGVQPAALADAIQQGVLNYSQPLGPESLTEISQSRLAHLRSHVHAADQVNADGVCSGNVNTITYPYSVPLIKDPSGTLTLSGEEDLCATFTVSVTFEAFSVQSFNASMSTGLHTLTEVTSTSKEKFSTKTDLMSYEYSPVTVLVGDVPVVLTPSITPFLAASGSANATVSAGVTTDATATLGVSYADSSWTPISAVVSPTAVNTPTSSEADADVRGSAGLRFGLGLYKNSPVNASVMLAPDGWLELKGGTTSNPCWTLDGGLEGDVAVVANLFDKKLGPYTSPEQSLYSTTVAQATGPCYTLAVTPATSVLAAGLIEQLTAVETDLLGNSVSATFNWSTSDPSVVTVDQTGVVTSVGGGTATITATDPKSTVSGAATVTVGCSQECYTFTFPQGIPTGETFKIYFYGTTIAGQPPVAILSGVAAGGTYTVPIETYYPTQPNEALYATVFASGPIEYQLTIPAPFVFEVNTDGVNFQVGQSFLDYTFPATGGASFVDTYVPPPVTDPSVRPQTRLR